MNNESGSALQKASFVLLLFIAAALGYLIMRERLQTERDRSAVDLRPDAPSTTQAVASPAFNPSEMKSSFAPLRPRVQTNTARAVKEGAIAARKSDSASS